jgi:putative membrane protein
MGKLMERKLKDYAVLMLKGMGMGAADVVPGVSGGTIAFIVGIYDELINSIKSINLESLKLFFCEKSGACTPFCINSPASATGVP